MCLDGAVRKCVPCPLHVWVSTVQVCIWLHLGMCLRLWYYVNMFKVFCSSLWWNVISFPLCTQKKNRNLWKWWRLWANAEDSCMCQVVVLSVSSQLLCWKRRTFLLLPSTAFPSVVVGASVAKTTSSLMLAARKKHTFALVVPIVTTSTLATVQRRKQQNKKLKS